MLYLKINFKIVHVLNIVRMVVLIARIQSAFVAAMVRLETSKTWPLVKTKKVLSWVTVSMIAKMIRLVGKIALKISMHNFLFVLVRYRNDY